MDRRDATSNSSGRWLLAAIVSGLFLFCPGLCLVSMQAGADPPETRIAEPEVAEGTLFVRINPLKRPWGVVFDGGFMYLAGNNFDIDRISPSGQVASFSRMLPDFVGPGMAFDSKKNLLIADGKSLLSLDPRGKVTTLLAGFSRALDLQTDVAGNLLVADDIEGRVYAIDRNLNKRVLIDRNLAPMWFALTSIAFDSRKENLYVAESVTGKILKYAYSPEGIVGTPEVIAEKIVGLRFLTVDADGNVYADTHFPVLIRIDPSKKQRRFFVPNLEDAAGMAFGKQGFDSKALYITQRYGVTRVRFGS